ncbi:ATP-dependent DNA helicase RecG [Actinomyces succiniciruminis]|uniref:ATP-dependent DNA helicase RecG n=1 Tax=Actinomyces succiniciruminis TaxID=1522002 RepID=A0A1L7RLE8_9ACTO|nr:ATP-dependent DNA helicase RecG [Actinomyces succiniciruminis]CED91969.1 ATP-dependent DNA helicase RecG [Actinomyces succiniciruminis]
MTTPSSARRPRGAVPLLDRPLDRLIGKTTATQLAKQGITTPRGLLRLFPRRYDTWGDLTDLRTLKDGEQATIQAQVVRAAARRTRSGRPPALMEATVTDGATTMGLVMFGNPGQMHHHAEQLAPGTTVLLYGKVGLRHGRLQLASTRFQVLDELDDAEREALLARPMPIYPGTESLPSWLVGRAVRTILDQIGPADIPEPLPEPVRTTEHLVDAYTAYRWVHTPEDATQWREARRRLRHEEAFVLQAALVQRRVQHAAEHTAVSWPIPGEESLLADLDAALPYPLTAGQVRVGGQIADALNSTVPMQLLLQGDVGSGKTLVALRAMLQVVDAGGQAALLAPTEILAAQHRASLEALLGPLAHAGMLDGAQRATRVRLLTGSTPPAQRRQLLADLAAGEPTIVVGTHALLSQTVQIPFLGLVVVDEQHRFGVAQRDALRERGGVTDPATGAQRTPHLLVMTATPIPRTIAMTIFGDLDTAVLDELPGGRRPVATSLAPWAREPWVERIWKRAAEEVAAGGRVYVVCPRIDADDAAGADQEEPELPGALLDEGGELPQEAAPTRPPAAVVDWAQQLAAEPALAGVGVGILTGRMSAAEKDAAMVDFISGRTPVLVCTTVVEVGVDVPSASMMVILDADRFGLSQLHQLRGRVGRGERESVCVAVTGVEVGSPAYHRLKAFGDISDGFQLAEADLELRSEGNVLGAAQSGRRSDLDLLRVSRDGALIARARKQAETVIAADPTLAEHRDLAAAIADRLDEEAGAYLERS